MRLLLRALGSALAVSALLLLLVLGLAEDPHEGPAHDPLLPIALPNGGEVVLERIPEVLADPAVQSTILVTDRWSGSEEARSSQDTDPVLNSERAAVALAIGRLQAGAWEEAAALLEQVPPGSPVYAKAQRFLGYKVYARRMEEPRRAVRYVNASLAAAPWDGNAWQDAARVYGSVLSSIWD